MKLRVLLLAALLLAGAMLTSAQQPKPEPAAKPSITIQANAEIELPRPNPAITNETSPLDLARAALAAHGGDRFRRVKTLFMSGTADISSERMTQVLPAKFAMTYKGEKTRMDLNSPMVNIRAINDGTRSYSSFKGFTMPSLNKFSTRVLARFDQPGYVVSGLPNKKKWRGFRVIDPDGDATDFYVDPATGRVMSYEFTYMNLHSIVENDKFRLVEGQLVPEKFAQRFETENMGAVFVDFKVKQIDVDLEVTDDVFAIPEP